MKRLVCVPLLLVLTCTVARAGIIHLGANRDTELLGPNGTSALADYAAGNFGQIYQTGIGQASPYYAEMATILSFDVSSLPAGTVDAITLRLYVSGAIETPRVYNTSVYSILASNKDWVEYRPLSGSHDPNGDLLSGSCKNWKDSSGAGNVNWASGGPFGSSDYSATALSTLALTTSNVGTYADFTFAGDSAALTSLINGWRTDNAGLLVHAPVVGTAIEELFFGSRENATAAYRPELIVNMVPEPSSVALLITGLFGLMAYAWRNRK